MPCCAGGSTLRGLIDTLLGNLRRTQRFGTGKALGRADRLKRPVDDWRLQAASIAVVTTEVLFGASPAWQPGSWPAAADSIPSTAEQNKQQEELEALVMLVQEEWVTEPLWGVPTSEDHGWHRDDSKAQRLTPQACCQPFFRALNTADSALSGLVIAALAGYGRHLDIPLFPAGDGGKGRCQL